MTAPRGDTTSTSPVERFKPTNGIVPGCVGLLVVTAGIGYVAFEVHTVTGLRVAIGLAFLGVLTWVTQLRSRAVAYPQTLLLKNSLVDTSIPLRLVDEVSVGRMLNVWVGDRRYVCIGIGRSLSSLLKGKRAGTLGFGKLQEYAEAAKHPGRDQSSMANETLVTTRIQELAESARKTPTPASEQNVRRLLAWPEIIALAVLGVAFLASPLL